MSTERLTELEYLRALDEWLVVYFGFGPEQDDSYHRKHIHEWIEEHTGKKVPLNRQGKE